MENQNITNYNATKHGCCALDTLILPTESKQEFEALAAAWLKTYNPQTEIENRLVDQLVAADWLLQRSIRTLAQVEAKIYAAEPDPTNWTGDQHKNLTRFQRYRTANQNAFNKHRKAVEDHLKNRVRDKIQNQKLESAQARHKAIEQKNEQRNKPEPTWKEHLENMRQKAIALGYAKPEPTNNL